jgi:hypothetical protein
LFRDYKVELACLADNFGAPAGVAQTTLQCATVLRIRTFQMRVLLSFGTNTGCSRSDHAVDRAAHETWRF